MKVRNMTSSKGNKIANQFIIQTGLNENINGLLCRNIEYFQSYKSIIVKKGIQYCDGKQITLLDRDKWDYSVITGKYRNQFLGETKKETEAKIKSGEYILTDLN